jgi:hypothetical protein
MLHDLSERVVREDAESKTPSPPTFRRHSEVPSAQAKQIDILSRTARVATVHTVNESRKQLVWKGLSAGAAAIAVLVTRRVVSGGWQRLRGEPPPEGIADRKVTWRTALTYAVAMGVGIAVAQVVAARLSARAWEVATHEAPPESG